MKITVLDASTIGDDIDLSVFGQFGETEIFGTTSAEETAARAKESDVLILNKVKINRNTLPDTGRVRLICIAATGTDNVDLAYCRERGVAVCNVAGYSTCSVAQLTVATALYIWNGMRVFTDYVSSGSYSKSGVANRLTPVFHELDGKTWGIVGYGSIGKRVGKVARALGCRVIAFKRTPVPDCECVDLDTLCRLSDVISVHLPLTDETRGIIDRRRLGLMKKSAVLINSARGAVLDEEAVADAVLDKKIAGFGCDVYSTEPMPVDHPYSRILTLPNVCLTPHNGWGAYEARDRCVREMAENIRSFLSGGRRSRVD